VFGNHRQANQTELTGPGYGLWVASSPVQADKTGFAVTEFAKELRRIGGERPITAPEFENARDQLGLGPDYDVD